MKRLVIFLAIASLLTSLLSSVAIASPANVHPVKITLDNTYLNYTESGQVRVVSGKIFSVDSKAKFQANPLIKISLDDGNGVFGPEDTEIAEFRAKDGEFSYKLFTNTDETGIGQYWVHGVNSIDDTEYTHSTQFAFSESTHFVVMYEIELDNNEDLNFTYPVEENVVISGSFINKDASTSPEIYLAYTKDFDSENPEETSIAKADVGTSSVFGFLLNGEQFDKTGEIALYVNGVKSLVGMVNFGELDLTITPNKLLSRIAEKITFEFNLPNIYYDGVNKSLGEDYQIIVVGTRPNGEVFKHILFDYNDPFKNFLNQETYFIFELSELGNYSFKFQLTYNEDHLLTSPSEVNYDDYMVIKQTVKEFKVVKPEKFNLMLWDLNAHSTGKLDFYFYDNISLSHNNIMIAKYDSQEESVDYMKYYEVTLKGCGVDTTVKNFDENGLLESSDSDYNNMFSVYPSETGDLNIEIKVYENHEADEPLYTTNKTVTIYGWNIEASHNTIEVNSEEDIVFTITDEANNPVNNAIIKLNDTVAVDGTTSNITGGRYIYSGDSEDMFKQVGTLNITLYSKTEHELGALGQYKLIKNNYIEVVGKETYKVESDQNTLLNGIKEELLITTVNEEGETVYPNYYRIDVDSKGNKSKPVLIPTTDMKPYIKCEDGTQARPISILPSKDQTEVIIRSTTDSQQCMGEVHIEVVKPTVELTTKEITESLKQKISVKIKDPRNDNVLGNDFSLEKVGSYYDSNLSNDWVYDEETLSFEKEILISNVNYAQAAKDEKDIILNLIMTGDDDTEVVLYSFAINKATLTTDPEQLILNIPSQVTLTYLDAESNAIKDKAVYVNGNYLGDTNENGQIGYSAEAISSIGLEFTAATDVDEVYIINKLRAKPDMEPPKAVIELINDGDSALITVTDNVRVFISYVNGELVDMKFPRKQAVHIVNELNPGENSFTVQSMDINNNILETVLTISSKVAPPLTLEINKPTGYGIVELKDGKTNIPLLLAQELGLTVKWENGIASISKGKNTLIINTKENTISHNGYTSELNGQLYINEKDIVMISLRLVAERFNYCIEYENSNSPIIVKQKLSK